MVVRIGIPKCNKTVCQFWCGEWIYLFIWYVHGFYCIIIVILRQEQEMTQNTPGLQVHIDMDMRELEITRQGHEISTIGSFRPSGRRDFLPWCSPTPPPSCCLARRRMAWAPSRTSCSPAWCQSRRSSGCSRSSCCSCSCNNSWLGSWCSCGQGSRSTWTWWSVIKVETSLWIITRSWNWRCQS